MSLPIIFIHRGNQDYVKIAIEQACRNNEKVILLGDTSNKIFCDAWEDMENLYDENRKRFQGAFKNYSLNMAQFEFGCFERYFIINEYMRLNKLSEIIMCDSDIMLYQNMSDVDYSDYDVALNTSNDPTDIYFSSGHCSYWTKGALESFIQFIVNSYESDKNREKLKKHGTFLYENCGKQGISDMTLLRDWIEQVPVKVWHISRLNGLNPIADHNMNCDETVFEMDSDTNLKRVEFINNTPHFYHEGRAIPAYSLHFQGHAKKYMESFLR